PRPFVAKQNGKAVTAWRQVRVDRRSPCCGVVVTSVPKGSISPGSVRRDRVRLRQRRHRRSGQPRDRRDRSPLLATVGYWGVGFAGGWLPAFPLGFGAVGLC